MRSTRNWRTCWTMPVKFLTTAVFVSCADAGVSGPQNCALSPVTNKPDCKLRTVLDLPGLSGYPVDINENGDILGEYDGQWLVWNKSGLRPLHAPAGYSRVYATALNNRGEAVGYAATPELSYKAILWDKQGVPRILPVPDIPANPFIQPRPVAINDRGDIAGVIEHPAGARSFFLSGAGEYRIVQGGPPVRAHDLNESGQVVGSVWADDQRQHAFVWSVQLGMQILPFLRPQEIHARAVGVGINDHGWVVGTETVPGARTMSFLWRPGEGIRALPALGGWPESDPADVNNAGEVVGTVYTDGGHTRAFVWSLEEGIYELPTGIGGSGGGFGINHFGDVIGVSTAGNTIPKLWARDPSRYR